MSDKVVSLQSVAPGFACGSNDELFRWADDWCSQFEEDGNVRSLVIIVETEDGDVFHVGQTRHRSQGAARVLGLIQILAHKILHGRGRHPSLEKEDT